MIEHENGRAHAEQRGWQRHLYEAGGAPTRVRSRRGRGSVPRGAAQLQAPGSAASAGGPDPRRPSGWRTPSNPRVPARHLVGYGCRGRGASRRLSRRVQLGTAGALAREVNPGVSGLGRDKRPDSLPKSVALWRELTRWRVWRVVFERAGRSWQCRVDWASGHCPAANAGHSAARRAA